MDVTLRASRDDFVMVTVHCPSRPYLELQIPGDAARVSSIRIKLRSRDQGFCDEEGRIGQPGFTWYELNVERPGGRNNIPRECIFQNPAGIPEWHETVISSGVGKAENLQRLVDEVQPLDIVQLCPRANFTGWINFICQAELEIHYTTSLVVPEPTPSLRPCYNKLDPDSDSIRLLDLLPGHDEDEICVKLTAMDIDSDNMVFEALSYCWGQPYHCRSEHTSNESIPIQCLDDTGRRLVLVSPSLWGALLHLRDSVQPRVLWVDQLCINQTDKDELSRQVSMMGRIYSRAERVIVWLGAGDVETERSVDVVNRWLPHFHEPSKDELKDGSFQCELSGVSIADLPHREVTRVLTLPWFWRVWVVQEMWLARRRTFMYGRRTLDWSTIRKANVWSKWGGFEIPGVPHTNLPLIWTSFAEMEFAKQSDDDEREQIQSPLHSDLLTLVIQGLDLKASDPRDHLFGLLGILEETLSGTKGPNQLVYPDYHKSTSQVYVDFTIWWILRTKSLRVLSSIQAIRGRTWQNIDCTDLSKASPHDQPPPEHPSWAMWYSGMRKWENESLAGSCHYRVTGGSEPNTSLIAWESPHRHSLKLQGYRLGRIQNIEPYRLRLDHIDSDFFKTYNRVFDASGSRRLYSTPVTEAFYGYKHNWDNPLQHWQAHGHRHGGQTIIPVALPCIDRCVFQLEHGSQGLCPAVTMPGDIVVILYGGDVPYILREAETRAHYRFVGECYLDGRMDGNLLAPFEEAETIRDDFVLI